MGLIRFIQKALKRDKNALIVRKQDDELTRYMKQQRITADRERFQKVVEDDEERRRQGLNVEEKRELYLTQVLNYEKNVYAKSEINDQMLNLDYLGDKKLYNPIGRSKWWFHPERFMYVLPLYTRFNQYSKDTPLVHYLIRVFGFAFFLNLGYRLGHWEAEQMNEKLRQSLLVEFKSEEQIFDYLYNKNKDAVLLQMYVPGVYRDTNFYRVMEEESSKKEYDNIVFMMVHCRRHISFCINKSFPNRVMPYAELYYLNEEDKIELMDMDNWHRSRAGVQGFLHHAGVVDKPKVFDIF